MENVESAMEIIINDTVNDDGENNEKEEDEDDDDDDDDDENNTKYYHHIIRPIKTKTGLDIGYKIQWPKYKRCYNYNKTDVVVNHHDGDSSSRSSSSKIENDTTTYVNNNDEYVTLEVSTQLPSSCIAPMFDGTQWAGTCLWKSAIVALQYLLYIRNEQQQQQQHTTMNDNINLKKDTATNNILHFDSTTTLLELGCGLGIPGMILHAITGCTSIVTDKDDLVNQLHNNIQKNFYHTAASNDTANIDQNITTIESIDILSTTTSSNNPVQQKIQAHALDWTLDSVQKLLERYINNDPTFQVDIILSCDCIYEPLYGMSWKSLINVQNILLQYYPNAYVITACERRKYDGIDSYIQHVQTNHQYEYISRIEQINIPFLHSPNIELYRLYGNI